MIHCTLKKIATKTTVIMFLEAAVPSQCVQKVLSTFSLPVCSKFNTDIIKQEKVKHTKISMFTETYIHFSVQVKQKYHVEHNTVTYY